jgi:tetratricopeptide (TPR) repeat protein
VLVGTAAMSATGFATPEVEIALNRAEDLCHEIVDRPEICPAIGALLSFHLGRGNIATAHRLAVRLLDIGRKESDDDILLDGCFAVGVTLYFQGRFTDALANLEQSTASAFTRKTHIAVAGLEFVIGALTNTAVCLWLLGYPDRALETIFKALDHARTANHPYSLAYARMFAGIVRSYRRECAAIEEIEALIAYSTDHGFLFLQGARIMMQSSLAVIEQPTPEALAQYTEIVAGFRKFGGIGLTEMLCALAEGYRRMADPERGLAAVAEALAVSETKGSQFWKAEIHRLRGELFLMEGEAEPAEQSFRTAITIAREQSAKSWELRSTTSLARLLAKRGRRDEARTMLASVYNWFNEGFDTPDLKDAKELLDELAT